MKKRMFVILLMIGVTIGVFAQSTKEVKGAVIDRNGNPLPGAKIEATGGAESTVTDADGTFSLEVSRWLKSVTASYPGMAKKKLSLKKGNELLFSLHEDNIHWFVNGVYQYDANLENSSIGVMGGLLNTWGWYAKVLVDVSKIEPKDPYYSSDNRADVPSISLGLIKSLSEPLYLYFGLGYTKCYDKNYYRVYLKDGLIVDLGLIYNYKHFDVNCGFSYRRQFHRYFKSSGHSDGKGLHIGIGYCF